MAFDLAYIECETAEQRTKRFERGDMDEIYPMLYGHGISEGIRLAYATPVTNRVADTRGRRCPCNGDPAVHRGFKAGWTATRRAVKVG